MKNEMGEACGTHRRKQEFWLEYLKEGDHAEELGVNTIA
jgi:hypothetical protein